VKIVNEQQMYEQIYNSHIISHHHTNIYKIIFKLKLKSLPSSMKEGIYIASYYMVLAKIPNESKRGHGYVDVNDKNA
jgi:hypothetical protein